MSKERYPTRPEIEVILRCARGTVAAHEDERLHALVRQSLDWDLLVALAARHRLRALMWAALSPFAEAIPPAPRAALQAFVDVNVARNLALTSQLVEVLALLAAEGIPALALKGPTLAALYGGLALREFNDLDLLIHRRDLARTRALLTSRGYHLPPFYERVLAGPYPVSEHHYPFFPSHHEREQIEVHCELVTWYLSVSFDTAAVLAEAGQVEVAGQTVRCLSPENLLLFLSVHATDDAWCRLEHVAAVAAMLRNHPHLQWNVVQRRAADMGAERMVRLAVWLTRHLLDAAVPAAVGEWVDRDRHLANLASPMVARLLDPAPRFPSELTRVWIHAAARERLRDRLQYCVRGCANIVLEACLR